MARTHADAARDTRMAQDVIKGQRRRPPRRSQPPLRTWHVAQLPLLKHLGLRSQLGATRSGAAAAALQHAQQLGQQLLLQPHAATAVHERDAACSQVL